ncbi:uncharacterized protein LOC127927028 [Oncorhynchus keta]|uniref:uncharacterized protein LOC127927028 n=1 Tax=Oncorhynchus keta TaxID=8018 RepID=UPI00227D594F|nr:uncharacterized protein LOC127927028 [Oncorhynchus keta]
MTLAQVKTTYVTSAVGIRVFAFVWLSVQVERRGLESHLLECEFRSRACPSGCGHTLLSVDQSQHNCVAELRTELELLRAEMLDKVEEVRREMESRLDSQRRHMVQKESLLKSEVEDLKGQVSRVMCDVRALLGAERLRRQELAEADLEKRELLEMLRSLQPCRGQRNRDEPIRGLHQEDGTIRSQLQVEHPTRGLLSLIPAYLPTARGGVTHGPPLSSLTLDCIKSREVTVI